MPFVNPVDATISPQAYSMNENFDGKYCGACHGKVAFPMIDCEHCHSKPVM